MEITIHPAVDKSIKNLSNVNSKLKNGSIFTNVPGNYSFDDKCYKPLECQENKYIEFLFKYFGQILKGENSINLFSAQKFQKGQHIFLDSEICRDMGNYIVIYNLDKIITIELDNSGEPRPIILNPGEMMFVKSKDIIDSNQKYIINNVNKNKEEHSFIIGFRLKLSENLNEVQELLFLGKKHQNKRVIVKNSIELDSVNNIPKKDNVKTTRRNRNRKKIIPKLLDLDYVEEYKDPLGKFEETRLLSVRAQNISDNFPIHINEANLGRLHPVNIAKKEFDQAKNDPDMREKLSYIKIVRNVSVKHNIPITKLIDYSEKEQYVTKSFTEELYQPLLDYEINLISNELNISKEALINDVLKFNKDSKIKEKYSKSKVERYKYENKSLTFGDIYQF